MTSLAHQIYQYRCRECGNKQLSTDRADNLGDCLEGTCTGTLFRVWAVSIHKPMMAHYNKSVQQEVTGMKDFAEKLKRKGEEYTERTGQATNYVPIEAGDLKGKVTNEGLESTNAERRKKGLKDFWVE